MSDTVERDVSSLLHASVGEGVPETPIYVGDVVKRAQRIRARRYGIGVAAVVAAVSVAAIVPAALLRRESAPPPLPATTDSGRWPVRGDLASNNSVITRARLAWDAALRSAGRGRLTERSHALFAGHVPGLGVAVVLTGVEPHGGQRVVVVSGRDLIHLSVYADTHGGVDDLLTVYLNPGARTGYDGCSTQTVSRRLLIVGPPSADTAVWVADPHRRPECSGNSKLGPPHSVGLINGWAITSVDEPVNGNIQLGVTDRRVTPGTVTGQEPVERLRGGRVAPVVPIVDAAAPQQIETHSSNGDQQSIGIGVGVSVGPQQGGDALGFGRRYDASSGGAQDGLFDLVRQRHPDNNNVSGWPLVTMALPDGTPMLLEIEVLADGSQYAYLAIPVDGKRTAGYLDRAVGGSNPRPHQLSAIVQTPTKRHYLVVVGQPGVESIEYRPGGSTHWQSLDVYLSTAFLRVKGSGSNGDRIRMRDTSGSIVYDGPIDARKPVGIGTSPFN